MDICKMALLMCILWHTCWKIMSVGLLFLPNVLIGLYTIFTAWSQEQTSLVDTLMWMRCFCMQSKQGPKFRLQWMTCRYGWNTLIKQPEYRAGCLGNMSFQMVLFQLHISITEKRIVHFAPQCTN